MIFPAKDSSLIKKYIRDMKPMPEDGDKLTENTCKHS